MIRVWCRRMAAVGLMVSVLAVAWAMFDPRGPVSTTEVHVPNTWQWSVRKLPANHHDKLLALAVRTREFTLHDPVPVSPVSASEGTERILWMDPLDSLAPGDPAVTAQLLDVRGLGVSTGMDSNPLRLSLTGKWDNSLANVVLVYGHSVVATEAHMPYRWQDEELPLMTITTVGRDRRYQTTILYVLGRAD